MYGLGLRLRSGGPKGPKAMPAGDRGLARSDFIPCRSKNAIEPELRQVVFGPTASKIDCTA